MASTPGHAHEPVIAIRSLGAGRLAVAGVVDGRAVERLRALLAAGCRVEFRNSSEALGVRLEDATLSEAFAADDAVRRHIPR